VVSRLSGMLRERLELGVGVRPGKACWVCERQDSTEGGRHPVLVERTFDLGGAVLCDPNGRNKPLSGSEGNVRTSRPRAACFLEDVDKLA
jgi:hypothetical protein